MSYVDDKDIVFDEDNAGSKAGSDTVEQFVKCPKSLIDRISSVITEIKSSRQGYAGDRVYSSSVFNAQKIDNLADDIKALNV